MIIKRIYEQNTLYCDHESDASPLRKFVMFAKQNTSRRVRRIVAVETFEVNMTENQEQNRDSS